MPTLFHRHFSLNLLVKLLLALTILSLLVFYALFQARLLITGPTISLSNELAYIQHERTITVSGNAQNIVSLTLNDRDIFTDDDGNFNEVLVLPDGYTIMTLKASDRYGRRTILEKQLMYQPLI